MNKVFFIGNITRDFELESTASGVAFCKFSIAVQRKFSKDKEVDYIDIVVWRAIAENCAKYLCKGKKVAVAGSLQINVYEKDGRKVKSFQVNAEDVEFLSPAGTPTSGDNEPSEDYGHGYEVETDKLPF